MKKCQICPLSWLHFCDKISPTAGLDFLGLTGLIVLSRLGNREAAGTFLGLILRPMILTCPCCPAAEKTEWQKELEEMKQEKKE